MFLNRAQLKPLLLAALLLASAAHAAARTHAHAQKMDATRDDATLARIERSIEQDRIEEIETALLDYAVAHPRDTRALTLLGRVRTRQRRVDEAVALYLRVLALEPTRLGARIALARLMHEAGRTDDARRLLDEAAPTSTIDAQTRLAEWEAQLALAEAWLHVGDARKSLATVERLPARVKNAEALPVVAASYAVLGEREKLAALMPAIRRASAADASVAVRCAEALRVAGLTGESIGLLRVALGRAPQNASALLLLGSLETEAGDFSRARANLSRAAALEPRSAEVHAAHAALEGAEGNASAAFAALERARSLAPDSQAITAQYVVAAMRAGRSAQAYAAANELLQAKPDEPEFVYLYGASALQNGNLNAAQKSLERFAGMRPRDGRGCLALGIALAGQPDRQEAARAQFERCIELDPAGSVEAKYQLGLVYKSQGENDKAIRLLEDATTRAPRHAPALRDLGALYLQRGADATRARIVLERAVALMPQDAETHFQLSRLYNRTGASALAARHLELFQKLKSQREKGTTP